MKISFVAAVLSIAAGCLSLPSQANIVITGTRVIYKADDREVTVKLNNVGADPSLVQVWVDKGNDKSTPSTADGPFLVMPPIFRVDPAKGQSLRITYTGANLPADKESVFWLNVLDVPPVPKATTEQNNYLQLAIRSRIKLFYRPMNLAGTPETAAEHLTWRLAPRNSGEGYVLRASNDSAYHVSFNRAILKNDKDAFETDGGMVEPGGQAEFVLKDMKALPGGALSVDFETINDYGGTLMQHQSLQR